VADPRRALLRADLPDHSGAGNMRKARIRGIPVLGLRVRLAEISYRPIVCDIGAAVRPEPHVCGTIEPGDPIDKRLFEGRIVGKALKFQGRRFAVPAVEVDQLDFVPDLGGRGAGIGWRKAEVAFEVVEGAARPSAIAAADPLSGTWRRIGEVAARFGSSPRLCGLATVRFRGVALRPRSWLAAQNRSFKSVFTVIRVACTVPWKWARKFPSRS